GLSMTRYNRIEGFSTGLLTEQQLGAGYTASLLMRLGLADREPNAELSFARSSSSKSISLTGYNRLVAASDWGNPLSFGSSVSALLFGRDEGFYYRATGVELAGTHGAWRLFAEQQRVAAVSGTVSMGAPWLPNVSARRATYLAGAMRLGQSYGLDPMALRVASTLRLEAASPIESAGYARIAADVTTSHGLGSAMLGSATLSAGTSAGNLPPQRHWFL